MSANPIQDIDFLKKALELAEERKGYTAPNPAVGALVVNQEGILGRGAHWASGYPHAEVEALKEVVNPEGSTLYVTLEPCCHFGKTPPCTELLKSKKIKRVVYAYQDPNPQVQGKGAQSLKDHGIEVTQLSIPEIDNFYQTFQKWILTGRSWLTGKVALTADGKTGASLKSRSQITGQAAALFTQSRRKRADIILTSLNTIRVDNPMMNVRLDETPQKKPVFILDRLLECENHYQVFTHAKSVSFIHGKSASSERRKLFLDQGFELIELSEKDSKLDFKDLSLELGKRGCHEAWCEFGPRLFSSFCREGVLDEMVILRSRHVSFPNAEPECRFEQELMNEKYRCVSQESLEVDTQEFWRLI